MTEFKVGDKVRVKTVSSRLGVYDYLVGKEGVVSLITRDRLPVRVKTAVGEYAFSGKNELELITPASHEGKDVWEWLVEQSYLSEHDGKQAKAEYEAFHNGVDALPTEVGWYESGVFPLRDGHNPYRLEWGIWYELGEDSLLETSHEEMLELMPLTKLGAEPGGEQA